MTKLLSALVASLALLQTSSAHGATSEPAAPYRLFARTNLVAWCIVPFDAKHRGPAERGEMLTRLGFSKVAYDWREQHVPTFEEEILTYKKRGLEFFAFWSTHDTAFDLFSKYGLHPQIWLTAPSPIAPTRDEQIRKAAAELLPVVERTRKAGCPLGLYNHGGWGGEPENLVAVCEYLRQNHNASHVGIVYNFHHGHGHIDDFAQSFARLKPYLLCLNINGMVGNGDAQGKMILTLAQGDQELAMLRVVQRSDWRGPIGILCHRTDADAELVLADNLDGLDWLKKEMANPGSAGPKPAQRAPLPLSPGRDGFHTVPVQPSSATPKPDYWAIEDAKAREKLPLYQTIPSAKPEELTPANGQPTRATFRNWHRSHGDNGGARFSALDQINRQNVTNLQIAWTYHSRDASNNIQCNPIVANGLMFAPTPAKYLVAVNAATGDEVWRFKPDGRPAIRGLIYWPGRRGTSERVMFCAGQFLYALNPKTGQPIGDFGSSGKTPLPDGARGDFGAASAAPAIFEDLIVVPGWEKDVWGFDVVTGTQRWTFHTVPQPGEFGYETWDKPEAYGANCWGGMALDEVRGIAYITTGSPKENFFGVNHRGDNLFANCVIALDARTGRRLWHFQEIRHDIWDLDIPAPPNLATITRDGRRVDVVAAVTKIGNTLLLDRVTGKPIFPFRLRRAPASDLPGEVTAPYQPDVQLPEPFSKQEFTENDLGARSEEVGDFARARFKSTTVGWFRPASEARMNLFFGIHGGAEWTGACVDPDTGHLFVSANNLAWIISVFRDDEPRYDPRAPKTPGQIVFETTCAQCHGTNRIGFGTAPPLRGLRLRMADEAVTNLVRQGRNGMPAQPNLSEADLKSLLDFLMLRDRPFPTAPPKAERPLYNFGGYPKFLDQEGYPANRPPWGTLNCLDLNTGKLLWKVPLGEYEQLTRNGVPKTGTENFGGAIVTAGGLVFCAGTRDHKLRAFDKDTGAELWSAKLPWVGSAPPASYEVDGRQYIVITATGGGKLGTPTGDAYIAFSLPKKR
jgi:quinoprotein glucose dehydrogenase